MRTAAVTPEEQDIISAAQTKRNQCECGDTHDRAITPAVKASMRGYLAAHPGHQFAWDDDIVAVIIPREPDAPEVIAWAHNLVDLVGKIDAPPAAELS